MWLQVHGPVSLRSWLGRSLRLSHPTGRFLACLHGKTLSSLGAWEGIRSSAREWITPSCWLGSKALLWSIKAIYRGFLCSAPDTFPAAASGKRSCQLLTFLPWTRTEPQGTPFLLASVTYSTLHGQRPSQWYWGEIFHGVCYSRCGVPCLLVNWQLSK